MSMTYWTYDTEKNIHSGVLRNYLNILNEQIIEIVNLVRIDISKLNRCTIEALIVLDVHNKDVVQILHDNEVT